jgi:hypothetical protein
MARQRNYKAEYAARKARAQAKGYTSPRTENAAKRVSKGLPARDYGLESERARIRRESTGVDTDAEYRAYKRARSQGEAAEKAWTLAYFGISARKFDAIRRENRAYKDWLQKNGTAMASAANTYLEERDKDVHNWSPMRVGYIVSFHGAVVNPASNWDSLPENKGKGARPGSGIKKMNKEQFYYLVYYSGIMSVPYFEARYGHQVVIDALTTKGKPKP